MDTQAWIGFGCILLGAICGGSFGLPSKYAKDAAWETLWGPFFLMATVIIPVTLGPVLVDDFYRIYSTVGIASLARPLIFGFLWGLGSMTLGMSFAFIGLSLAYSLNYGAQIVFGSIMPMVLHEPDQISTAHGYVILAGVATCVAGVILAGRAGILKDRNLKKASSDESSAGDDGKQPKMLIGVLIGVLSGVLCACYVVAWTYAGTVREVSGQLQNAGWQTEWAVAALIVWGGSVSSCLYCVFQLSKNKTWNSFARPGVGFILFLALTMALLHDGAIFLFGLGADYLGTLGGSVGYAVFMSFAIIVGNVHGFRTGEWKGAGRQSTAWITAGIVVLVLGVCILAKGRAMAAEAAKEAESDQAAVRLVETGGSG